MKHFFNCETRHTGLYKPHTIYINNIGISIVYYSKENINGQIIGIATDTNNNTYEIYETKSIYGNTGHLAFPCNPKSIKGFYPYL